MSKKLVKASLFTVLGSIAAISLASCDDLLVEVEQRKEPIKICVPSEEQSVIKQIIDSVNEGLKEKYTVTFVNKGEADAGQDLKENADSSTAADLYLIADDQLNGLKKAEAITALSAEDKIWVLNKNNKASTDAISSGNDVFGYPVSCDNGYFLWYDRTVISDDKATSLEAILHQCQDVGKSFAMDLANGYYANTFIMSPQACGNNSLTWSDVGGNNVYMTSWDDENGVKASTYISSLLAPYIADGTFKSENNDAITADLENGSVVATILGTWEEQAFKTAMNGKTPKGEVAATKLPSYHIDGKAYQMASFVGAKLFVVNAKKSEEAQKTARQIAKIITDTDGQLKRFSVRKIIPSNTAALKSRAYLDNSSIGAKALTAQAEFGASQSRCAEDRYWSVGAEVGSAYINGLPEGKTWQEFLTEKMDLLRHAPVAA